MTEEELTRLYRILRQELDAAYAAKTWDQERIDRIAADMLPVERQLARLQPHSALPAGRGASE